MRPNLRQICILLGQYWYFAYLDLSAPPKVLYCCKLLHTNIRGAHFHYLDQSCVGLEWSGLFWDRCQNGPVFFKPDSAGLFHPVLFWIGLILARSFPIRSFFKTVSAGLFRVGPHGIFVRIIKQRFNHNSEMRKCKLYTRDVRLT